LLIRWQKLNRSNFRTVDKGVLFTSLDKINKALTSALLPTVKRKLEEQVGLTTIPLWYQEFN